VSILNHSKRFLKSGNAITPTYSHKPNLEPVVKPAFIVRDSTFQNRYSAKR